MKEMNRRAFLTLTGAALAMMALTACDADDVPVAPPAPPAPAAPTTSKEAKVLEAINLYRKEKKLGTFEMDDRLNGVTEDVVNRVGKTTYEDIFNKMMAKLYGMASADPNFPYEDFGPPFGVDSKGAPTMLYDEDINVMKNTLLALDSADTADNIGKSGVNLISIKVFTASDGKVYWVALVAKGKVNP